MLKKGGQEKEAENFTSVSCWKEKVKVRERVEGECESQGN
jgi:hypothetical protein